MLTASLGWPGALWAQVQAQGQNATAIGPNGSVTSTTDVPIPPKQANVNLPSNGTPKSPGAGAQVMPSPAATMPIAPGMATSTKLAIGGILALGGGLLYLRSRKPRAVAAGVSGARRRR